MANCKRLRGQFPQDNVEEGENRKAHAECDRVDDVDVDNAEQTARPDEHVGEKGFSNPAKAKARQRNSQLSGREVGIEVADNILDNLRMAAARPQPLLDLRTPNLDDRKLRRHEESVGNDKQQYEYQ